MMSMKLDYKDILKDFKDLEYTGVYPGFYLDFWCMPGVKSYMPPMTIALDLPNHAAGIPGSGEVTSTFTHTSDVAKFVAGMLDLGSWDRETWIVGDRITWNEFVRLAEE